MRIFLWKGCVLLLLLTGSAHAEGSPLTFEQVMDYALQGHPIERAQQASLRVTAALVQQAGVKPNPTLQLQTQTDGFERTSQLGLSVSQRLELGGKRAARVKAADANHIENTLQTEVRMALFRYELKEGFLKLLMAQRSKDLALQSLDITQRHLKIAQARFEAGDLSGAELANLKVEEQRKLAQVAVSEAETARASAELGKYVRDPALLKEGVQGKLGASEGLPPLESLYSERLLAHRLAKANVKSKEAEVFLEKAKGVSDITLQVGAFTQRTVFPGSSFSPAGAVSGLDDTGPLLQFQIQIPIPLNDNNSGNIAASRARREQAEFEFQALELELAANLEGLYRTLQGQQQARLILSEQAEPAALKSLKAIEEAYRLGFRSQLDLLLAKQTYLETRKTIIQASFDESLTESQIERILGRPLIEQEERI